MKDFDAIVKKWEKQTSGKRRPAVRDRIFTGVAYGAAAVGAVLSVLALGHTWNIYRYAVDQGLPAQTVLYRLGQLDLPLAFALVSLFAFALFRRFYGRFVFNSGKSFAMIVVAGCPFGLGSGTVPALSRTYRQAMAPVQTPLGTVLVQRANEEMSRARVEMGTIRSVKPLARNTYTVELQSGERTDTYTMTAPAIPPVDTPIWVAYAETGSGRVMQNMGVLPDGALGE